MRKYIIGGVVIAVFLGLFVVARGVVSFTYGISEDYLVSKKTDSGSSTASSSSVDTEKVYIDGVSGSEDEMLDMSSLEDFIGSFKSIIGDSGKIISNSSSYREDLRYLCDMYIYENLIVVCEPSGGVVEFRVRDIGVRVEIEKHLVESSAMFIEDGWLVYRPLGGALVEDE